jgi:regulator of protease activity HflC (stomatin/prohibitin superfamily)
MDRMRAERETRVKQFQAEGEKEAVSSAPALITKPAKSWQKPMPAH